jgi:REP element-mobilizing transposase RayT
VTFDEFGPFYNIGDFKLDDRLTGWLACFIAMPRKRRLRKPKGQLSFPKRDKNGQLRGGARPGAGRPRKGERAGAPHKRRPEIDPRLPVHAVLRVASGVSWLRTPHAYRAVRAALSAMLDGADLFRIVHFSLQGDHVHLLCEASDRMALARGLQSFEISAAKHLNRECSRRGKRRRGKVFPDRYFAESINSVHQVRHTLNYVLNNWRKHRQDGGYSLFDGRIDPYSSGILFAGWKERTLPVSIPEGYEAPRVSEARSWYLMTGYKLGPPISVYDVPGPRRGGELIEVG